MLLLHANMRGFHKECSEHCKWSQNSHGGPVFRLAFLIYHGAVSILIYYSRSSQSRSWPWDDYSDKLLSVINKLLQINAKITP
jgi:hypothetical protein